MTTPVKASATQAPAQVGGQKVNDAKAAILINSARKDLGYHEGPNNSNKFTKAPNAPWCAGFVSAKLKEAGVAGIKGSDGCAELANQFKAAGKYTDSSKPPQPGDVIFFGNPPHHTGIVQKVDLASGRVYTIEGNSSDAVSQCSYSLKDGGISGYGKTFAPGTVRDDLGFNVSEANAQKAGGAPRNPAAARANPSQATETGRDGGVYGRYNYLLALLEAILNSDTEAITALMKELFPNATPEQIDGAMNALKNDPELMAQMLANPEPMMNALLADSSPAGIDAVKRSPPKPAPGTAEDNAQLAKDILRSTELNPAGERLREQTLALANKPKSQGWVPKTSGFAPTEK